MSDMKVKAMAPWFGGKRTMAPLIVTQLGKHLHAQNGRGARPKVAPEILILNGPEF